MFVLAHPKDRWNVGRKRTETDRGQNNSMDWAGPEIPEEAFATMFVSEANETTDRCGGGDGAISDDLLRKRVAVVMGPVAEEATEVVDGVAVASACTSCTIMGPRFSSVDEKDVDRRAVLGDAVV